VPRDAQQYSHQGKAGSCIAANLVWSQQKYIGTGKGEIMKTCKFCRRDYEPEKVSQEWPSLQGDKFCSPDCEEFYYNENPKIYIRHRLAGAGLYQGRPGLRLVGDLDSIDIRRQAIISFFNKLKG